MKTFTVLLGILTTIFITTPGYAIPVYWSANGHWYELVRPYVSKQTSWSEAKDSAEQKGGYLATLTSQAENDFVFSSLPSTGFSYGWLGGYRISDGIESTEGWAWITGEDWSYSSWSTNEPNNSWPSFLMYTVQGSVFTGKWGDEPESQSLWTYIIEYDNEPSLENKPPVIEVGEDRSIRIDHQYNLDDSCQIPDPRIISGVTIDPDWDILTYRWLDNDEVVVDWSPAGVSGGEASLDLSKIRPLTSGIHHFVLEVTDGVSTTSAGMNVTVIDVIYTQEEYDQAIANANAAKDLIIEEKDQLITTLNETITQKNQIITTLNTTIASMFTKTQLDDAVAEANAAKDTIIADKDLVIASLNETISQKDDTIALMFTQQQLDQALIDATTLKDLVISERDETISALNSNISQKDQAIIELSSTILSQNEIIATMFTQNELDQAIAEANAAKDLILEEMEQTIASMFTQEQLDQAIETERTKYDPNRDGMIGLEDIIYYLQVVAGIRSTYYPAP